MPRRRKRPEKIVPPKKKKQLKSADQTSRAARRSTEKKKKALSSVVEPPHTKLIASGLAPEILNTSNTTNLRLSSPVICEILHKAQGLITVTVENNYNKVNDNHLKPIGNQYGGVQNVPPSSSKKVPLPEFEQIITASALASTVLFLQHEQTSRRILDLAYLLSSEPIVKFLKQDEYATASLVCITIPAFAFEACESNVFTQRDMLYSAMEQCLSRYSLSASDPNNWNFRKLAIEFAIDIEVHRRSSSLQKTIYWYCTEGKCTEQHIPMQQMFPRPISKTAYLFFADTEGKNHVFAYLTSLFTIQYEDEKIKNPLVLGNFVRDETMIITPEEECCFVKGLVTDNIVNNLMGDGNCWLYSLIMIIPNFAQQICEKQDNQFLVDIIYNARITLQEQIQIFKDREPLVFMVVLKDIITEDGLIKFDHDTALEEFNMLLNSLVPFTKSKKKIYCYVTDNNNNLTKRSEIIDKLVCQNPSMLYRFVAKIYDITIQDDFITGNTAGTIIYRPGGKTSDYQPDGGFKPFRVSSHEKSLLTYYYQESVHTTPYTKSLFINDPNVFSSKVVHSDKEIRSKSPTNGTPTRKKPPPTTTADKINRTPTRKKHPPTTRGDEITRIGLKKINNGLSNVKKKITTTTTDDVLRLDFDHTTLSPKLRDLVHPNNIYDNGDINSANNNNEPLYIGDTISYSTPTGIFGNPRDYRSTRICGFHKEPVGPTNFMLVLGNGELLPRDHFICRDRDKDNKALQGTFRPIETYYIHYECSNTNTSDPFMNTVSDLKNIMEDTVDMINNTPIHNNTPHTPSSQSQLTQSQLRTHLKSIKTLSSPSPSYHQHSSLQSSPTQFPASKISNDDTLLHCSRTNPSSVSTLVSVPLLLDDQTKK